MKVIIEYSFENIDEIDEVVKKVSDIEKEYSCNCTLKLNKLNYVEFNADILEGIC